MRIQSKCKWCGNKFDIIALGRVNQKNFCSVKCQQRNSSYKQHQKRKDNPEFKRKRREYFRKWVENNREHFNDLMREKSRLSMRRRYNKNISKGLCGYCGKKIEPERDGMHSCLHCLNKRRKYNEKRHK